MRITSNCFIRFSTVFKKIIIVSLFIIILILISNNKSGNFNGSLLFAQSQPSYNQGIWIEYIESNPYYDPNDPSKVYFAENLFDNLYNTSWVSQSKVTQPTIKINFHIPMTISSLYIKNGLNDESTQDYQDNGRVKTLQIRTKYKNYNFNISDTSQWQKLNFESITTDYIELVVLEFYPGKRWFTIAMSELSFNFPSNFLITDITEKGQNLYSWMLQNIPMNMPKDKFQYSKTLTDYLKTLISTIGLPVESSPTVREQAFPYFAFISNRKFLPFSAGFPRNDEILNLYRDSFGSPDFMKYQVMDAYSPSYFFLLYANAFQPYTAMLAKSILLNTITQKDQSVLTDRYFSELLLHFLILGMDLRSPYYKNKYGKTIINGLPISARIQFTFYRLLRSLRDSPYKPIKFYLTVMLEDAMELQDYISMLVNYITDKQTFEKDYLETGEVLHITYNNDDFFVASIGKVDEFSQFAISMYLHNEDLIRYFKNMITSLNYDQQIITELTKILLESNYYAKHPEHQYY